MNISRSIFSLILLVFTSTAYGQVIDIIDARDLPEDTEVTVTGVLTNGPELGIIRYMQDGTAGIAAYGGDVDGTLLGDSITVTGILKMYNGLLEVDPIISLENHGPAVNPIEPIGITLNEMDESTESILVNVETCVFADGGGTFTGNNSYNITSNGQTGTVYVRTGHPLVGQLIPVGAVDLTGIVSQFTFTGFGGYQLLLRGPEDISSPNPVNIISAITLSEMESNGFTLSWVTDVPATTETFYTSDIDGNGLTDNVQTISESNTNHTLMLTDLDPGEVYFLQVYSVAGEDTAYSNIMAAATVSNSTGTIKAYFNGSVDNSYAEPAENLAISTNLRDTIVAYIDMAQTSLDLAIYNINNSVITDAINDAIDRGVTIRYIAEGQNANIGLINLDPTVPVLFRENAMGSGMHNKFVIVDYDSENESFVLTGSTNFTNNNLFTDYNNLVIIQDRALAKAYTIEFNEMWGSSGSEPNEATSRFGSEKINNTPKDFMIGGKKVELYFSPSDGTTFGILNALESADASIDFALLLLTQNDLADMVIAQSDNFFIDVSGILNDVNISGSDFDQMVQAGVYVIQHTPEPVLHHKYVIVDQADFSADPLVLTGSHNWSASADTDNDENTLVIHDATITNQFYQEYMARFNEVIVNVNNPEIQEFKLFPNPAQDQFSLQFTSQSAANSQLTITDLQGKAVFAHSFGTYVGQNNMQISVAALPAGAYIVSLEGDWGRTTEKLIISR